MIIQVTLTPAEGKRLIGKTIASMPEVQDAYKKGILIIATSTTTAYVLEELIGQEIKDKGMFTAGVVTATGCNVTQSDGRYNHHVFDNGQIKECTTPELVPFLAKMGPNDVFIKGANAIDPFGSAGILLAGAGGGTIGTAYGHLVANGVPIIVAAGLEKLVPISLADVVPRMGKKVIDKALGWKCGMMVIQGQIITEMEALKLLFGVDAIPIAGGGIDGAEGCKVFLLEGQDENIEAAYQLITEIKGEKPLNTKVTKVPS